MNLARSLGSVGGLTLVSRVLALVRDTLQASFVGASFASDAFFVAFRLPNMFRALFAEGAFSAAFIPMFNRKVGETDDVNAGVRFAEQTLAVLFPFARQVIAEAVANTGFPPLLLDPIDFASAYMAQVEAAQEQSGVGELTGEGPGDA